MKPILIDELVKESHTQTKINRQLMGFNVRGWKITKPLNHKFTLLERIKLSCYILCGKAIAVQFFEDLSENDKDNYIKKSLKK